MIRFQADQLREAVSDRTADLKGEILARQHAETALREANRTLEDSVKERTHELQLEIARRKKDQQEVRNLFRAVEQSPASIVVTDREGLIEYANRKYTEICNIPQDDLVGSKATFLTSVCMDAESLVHLWSTVLAGATWIGESTPSTARAGSGWQRSTVSPIRDDAGVITNLVAVIEDVTAQKQSEIELRRAKEQAESANAARSQFLASMSHELRTPLNAVIGFAEVIMGDANGGLSAEATKAYAEYIRDSGNHLMSIINEILDVSKIDSGKFTLREAIVDLRTTMNGSINIVRNRAEKGEVILVEDLEDLPLAVRADERAFRQIMINLISNAVKFTPEGGTVAIRGRLTDLGGLELITEDTGIGIAPEDIETALQPFGQIDSLLARRHEGTGLGLPLAKSLTELHGGTMKIDSSVGFGTTVTVRFPPWRTIGTLEAFSDDVGPYDDRSTREQGSARTLNPEGRPVSAGFP